MDMHMCLVDENKAIFFFFFTVAVLALGVACFGRLGVMFIVVFF